MYIRDVNIDHRSESSELAAVEQRGGWPLQAQGLAATEECEREKGVV
jgi:hypothetical protein